MKFQNLFSSSLNSNGYIYLGELLLQWGKVTSTGSQIIAFPKMYTKQVFVVIPVCGYSRIVSDGDCNIDLNNITLNNFKLHLRLGIAYWISLGI